MVVLGLNFISHDASACLVVDGVVLGALEEERLNLEKHTKKFPLNASLRLLESFGYSIDQVDHVAVGWNFDVFVKNYFDDTRGEYFETISGWRNLLKSELRYHGDVRVLDHHLAHTVYAYYASSFDACVSVVIDGFGDSHTCSVFSASKNVGFDFLEGVEYPESFGLWYSAFTEFLGFRRNCDEGIVMGLAPFGDSSRYIRDFFPQSVSDLTYIEVVRDLLAVSPGSSGVAVKLNRDFFNLGFSSEKFFTSQFLDVFGAPMSYSSEPSEHSKNIASAIQQVLEERLLEYFQHVGGKYDCRNIVYSGGVALNCVANYKIRDALGLDGFFVPPNPGDAGVAIGAALAVVSEKYAVDRYSVREARGPIYPKPFVKPQNIKRTKFDGVELVTTDQELAKEMLVRYLIEGKIIAVFRAGSEFGPRALGNRSILTLPHPSSMKDILNSRVKFRESFRPFAPIVPFEFQQDYFFFDMVSPHMMFAAPVKPHAVGKIDAAIHVDGTCRVQTIEKDVDEWLYELLITIKAKTGTAVLLNTSFNVKGQPIVETPEDAVMTIANTNIDGLYLDGAFFAKNSS